jgi:sulfite reductase (NADPH) hemoprotein beta-component
LKYTIDRLGLDFFKKELNQRLTWELLPPEPFRFDSNSDRYGWSHTETGDWNLTLFIEGGRITDTENAQLKKALFEIAEFHSGDFRLTGNQNLIIANIPDAKRKKVAGVFSKYGIHLNSVHGGLRLNSLACVALNTCPLAFAEAERYLPSLVTRLEHVLEKRNLMKESISIRMTGCPNGCARPYISEIGLVGKSIGHYNLYLGGNQEGSRLNKLYLETANEEQILSALEPMIDAWSSERQPEERFGDFLVRTGVV